jgi:hypothetical protein
VPPFIFSAASHHRLFVTASHRLLMAASHHRRPRSIALRPVGSGIAPHQQPPPSAVILHLAWSPALSLSSASAALHRRRRWPPRSSRSDTNCWCCISQRLFFFYLSQLSPKLSCVFLKNTHTHTTKEEQTLPRNTSLVTNGTTFSSLQPSRL